MALIKTGYKNGAGVSSEYWRVIDYKSNTVLKYVDMTFGGWVNEECRLANMELSDTPRKVRCMKDKFDLYFGTDIINGMDVNMVLQMYKFAKENSEFFIDATDALDAVIPTEPSTPSKSTADLLQDKINILQDEVLNAQEAINFVLMNY